MVKPVPPEQKTLEPSSGNDGVVMHYSSEDSVEILEKELSPVESTRINQTSNAERKLKSNLRKSKSKIPNSMQKVRQVMDQLRQDKQRQLEQIQAEIETDLQKANRTSTSPWTELFSVTRNRTAKKPGKTWIDSTHH